MSNLVQRVLFGVVAVPLTVVVLIFYSKASLILITALMLYGLHEFFSMFDKYFKGWVLHKITGFAVATALLTSAYYKVNYTPSSLMALFTVSAIFVFLLLVISELRHAKIETAPFRIGLWFLGVFYCGYLGSYIYKLYLVNLTPDSVTFLLVIFTGIWGGDSLAYFFGKFLGKKKMAPSISPKKTVVGCVAGLISPIPMIILWQWVFNMELALVHSVLIGLIIGVFGQVGDFWESILKRAAGKKDSSNIFPGHGGVLDRFDSLLFTAPLIYIYLECFNLL